MPVSQMRTYMKLIQQRQHDPDRILPELIQLLKDHRETVLANLEELHQNIEAIEYKINLYTSDLEELTQHENTQTT